MFLSSSPFFLRQRANTANANNIKNQENEPAHTGGEGRRGLLYVSKRQLAGKAVHVHEGEDPNMKILYVQHIRIVHAVSQFQDSSSTSEMKFW